MVRGGFRAAGGCGGRLFFLSDGKLGIGDPAPPHYSYAELTGSFFLPSPKEPYGLPRVRELAPPPTNDAYSVWGALGRDVRGHIWVGVSARSRGSAHLLEYDPAADAWHDRGGIVDRLKAAGVDREGEGQVKIHSKIVTANDGWLYFASVDEDGEKSDGTRLPRWGGHLWRIDPQRHAWQHLAAVPEALIAVSGVGRYIYALGYWDHVLYQYDTATGKMRRAVVGSVGGHVSRNFLADARGHAYALNTGNLKGLLLYGSVSRDNDGRAYVGGWVTKGQRPVVLQIDPGR